MAGNAGYYAKRIILDAFVFSIIALVLAFLFNVADQVGAASYAQSQFTSLYSLSLPNSNLAIIAAIGGTFLIAILALAFFYFIIPSERKTFRGEHKLAKKVFRDESERPYTTF